MVVSHSQPTFADFDFRTNTSVIVYFVERNCESWLKSGEILNMSDISEKLAVLFPDYDDMSCCNAILSNLKGRNPLQVPFIP